MRSMISRFTRTRLSLILCGIGLLTAGLFTTDAPRALGQQYEQPLLLQPFAVQPIAQQPNIPPAVQTVDVSDVIARGRQLEADHRWGEALALYEESLRKRGEEPNLRNLFELARLHYDLSRRYHDQSFKRMTAAAGEADALDLYADVLLKLQTHHVDAPDWRRLVDRGTLALEVAIGDPEFAERYGLQLTPEQQRTFMAQLRQQLSVRTVRSRFEARDVVAYAARYTQAQLRISSPVVVYEYLSGVTNSLDDYTSFLTADQLTDVYSQIDGNFVGLGIELKADQRGLNVLRVIPGSPAAIGGLLAGDRIMAVDGAPTDNSSTDQAADLLQGVEGSTVELVVQGADGATRTGRFQRRRVDVPSVENAEIVDAEYGVGYMKIVSFQKSTPRDVDTALWNLHRQGMRSLVIDLRGNPGGLLTAAVEVADKFVEQGLLVSTKGRNPREDFSYEAHAGGTWRVPLVILIDGDSASASEILAGAIRDHRRGTLVGTRSYGKGSVQGIFPLGRNSVGIRLTTAKFYSPNGKPFHRVGVEPDIAVQQAAKPIADGVAGEKPSDATLDAGVQVAREQVARK